MNYDTRNSSKPGSNDLRRRLVFGTALATGSFLGFYGGYVRRAYAACTGGSGTYSCSGAETITQALNPGTPLIVTTDPGFSIVTTATDAFKLEGTGGLSFTDNNASTITGEQTGIYADNFSAGVLTISTSGTVTGTNRYGIRAQNLGTDLSITAVNTSGGTTGIDATNSGTGALTINSSGTATGINGAGISAYNASASSTDLSITAVDAGGSVIGIFAGNNGTGATTITVTGTVSGTAHTGIRAFNSGTDLSITAVDTIGGVQGILATNSGTGALTINSSGTATGTNNYGIGAHNNATGTDLSITSVNASGGVVGIFANNYGSGALTINSSGTATGTNAFGISAYNGANGTDLNITSVNASGGIMGIVAENQGTGTTTISVSGAVNGSVGIRNTTYNNATVNIAATARVTGTAGNAIFDGNGATTVNSAGTITGDVNLRGGDDRFNWLGGSVSGELDGGAGNDVLTFAGGIQSVDGAKLIDWETIAVSGGATTISGALTTGALNVLGGALTVTGNNSGFTGTSNITGGSLYVNNALGGTVNVAGGTLGGSGTLGDLTVASGGNIAPGNSIGTLNVANATFAAGSTYTVELNNSGFVAGTNNDLLNAGGTVTIDGGTVHVTPVNGTDPGSTYTPGTYTIITAATAVTGTFAMLSDDYAFLNFALSYDANHVFLTSSLAATTFCLTGMSANQCATGDGVFSLGSGSLRTAVLGLSTAEAPVAMNLLSGEMHASAKTVLIEDSRFAREAALQRLRIALGGEAAGSDAQAEKRIGDDFSFWSQGFGSWASWASDGNAAELDRSVGGFFLGGDTLVTDDIRLGLIGGYNRSSFTINDRNSSGTADTYTVGAYGGGEWDAFSLKGGAAYSWHSLDTSRSVAFTGFSDSLSASYNARTFQAYGEAAYGFDVWGARFEPFANLAHVNFSTDGYSETGGAAALTATGQSTGMTFTTIGLRAQTEVSLGETTASLSSTAGWRHAFGDTPTATHAFDGGNAFTVSGMPIARDAFVLDLEARVNLTESATLGLSYNGQLGAGFTDQGLKANLAVKF